MDISYRERKTIIFPLSPCILIPREKNDCDRWKERKAYVVILSQSRTIVHGGNQRQSSTTLAPQDHTVLKI